MTDVSRREQLAHEADRTPLVEHERAYVPISALETLLVEWSERRHGVRGAEQVVDDVLGYALAGYGAGIMGCDIDLRQVLKEYGGGKGA